MKMDLVGKEIGIISIRLDLEVCMMVKEIEFIVDLCLKERRLDLERSILLIIIQWIIVVVLSSLVKKLERRLAKSER